MYLSNNSTSEFSMRLQRLMDETSTVGLLLSKCIAEINRIYMHLLVSTYTHLLLLKGLDDKVSMKVCLLPSIYCQIMC